MIIDNISAIAVPVFRSAGFSFPSNFPINDLFEIEIKMGKFVFRSFNFLIISTSRLAQSDLIFVYGRLFFTSEERLKKPMDGSTTILSLDICAFSAIFTLSFKNFFVADKLCNLSSGSDTLDQVIIVGDDIPDGAINYEDLLVEGVPYVGNPPVGSDPFLLLYTSGTTSNPKGVPLTYQNMLGHARLCAPEFGMTEKDRILSVAPFCHLFGLYNYHCALYAGAATVLLPTFSPPEFTKLVEKVSPTALFMGPAHAAAFRQTDLLSSHDFSSVNYSVFSGANCPPDLLKWWKSQTGSLVCQLWGMTELAAGTFSRPDMDENIGFNCAGPVSPGNEIRVVSSESGEELQAGLEGELQIRGSSVFPGYFNNDEANKSAFTKDGWFKTGDLAKMSEARCLEITGRTKDIINRGGVKYNPSEVEELIFSHPSVDMVAIVPMSDDVLGEKACCFVKLREGEKLTLEVLIQYLENKKVSKGKWPERLEIIDEMPLTPTRKIIKGKLLELID